MSVGRKLPVIVLGAGGHAAVLVGCIQRIGLKILGVTDPAKEKGETLLGVEILGGDDVVFGYSPKDVNLVNGLGIVEGASRRWEIAEKMREAGFSFNTVIDTEATVSSDVSLGEGVQIMAGAVIQPQSSIGRDSIVNTGALIDHDCTVGSECHICPGVTISGGVTVGCRSIIGSGSTVLPGMNIGNKVLVAAATVVYNDVSNNVKLVQRRIDVIEEFGLDKNS